MFKELLPISILAGIIFALYLQKPKPVPVPVPVVSQEYTPQPETLPVKPELLQLNEDKQIHNKNIINQLDDYVKKSKVANYSQQSISSGAVKLLDITDELP